MKKPQFSKRVFLTVLFDFVFNAFAFFTCYLYLLNFINHPLFDYNSFLWANLIYTCSMSLCIFIFGGYKIKYVFRPNQNMFMLFPAIIGADIITILALRSMNYHYAKGVLATSAISLCIMVAFRLLQYYLSGAFFNKFPYSKRNGKPTLIIGAGFTGKMVFTELTEGDGEYSPVCFVDENKDLISKRVCGLPVYGPCMIIPELVKKFNIALIIIAIPSAGKKEIKNILTFCADAKCEIRMVPSVNALVSNKNFFKQSHQVDVAKLLGREVIKLNHTKAKQLIDNKNCLVTGGGGSIGSELCRQIIALNPKKLVILDIYENNAYEIQQELLQKGYTKEQVIVEIASVRDQEKIDHIFKKYKFDTVFHAAAHKHVPLMEDNPEEAVKNNIGGTYNVANCSQKYHVKNMLLISTDKAVNPTNVMGATKRVCEMVLQSVANKPDNKTIFCMVRFGNVLGSNGSVIPLFTKQIEAGGPLTVTHPDIIRYFMTIPEAVSLVIEAASIATGGEVFVLDMGEPVKIVSLAENLIRLFGYEPYQDIDIDFCGLRPGEKLYEELLMNEEGLGKTENQKIFIGHVSPVSDSFEDDLKTLFDTAQNNTSKSVVKQLHKIVETYHVPQVESSVVQ